MRRRTSSGFGLPAFAGRRLAALLAGAALVLTSPLEAAAEPAEDPTAADLFREGQASVAAADYAGAIEHFEAAMRLVAHDPDAVGVRNRMRTELVIAHLRAYDVDGETSHLRKADLLLDDYEHDLDPAQTDEQAWVTERRAEIQERSAAAAAVASSEAQPEPIEAQPEPIEAQPEPPAPAPAPAPIDDRRDDERIARNMMFAGGIATGLGVVGGVLAITGFAMANSAVDTFQNVPNQRDDARAQNRTGNNLGIAGGIVAGTALPTGVALLVIGAKRKKQARSATTLLPYAGPDGRGGEAAGLTLRGRF